MKSVLLITFIFRKNWVITELLWIVLTQCMQHIYEDCPLYHLPLYPPTPLSTALSCDPAEVWRLDTGSCGGTSASSRGPHTVITRSSGSHSCILKINMEYIQPNMVLSWIFLKKIIIIQECDLSHKVTVTTIQVYSGCDVTAILTDNNTEVGIKAFYINPHDHVCRFSTPPPVVAPTWTRLPSLTNMSPHFRWWMCRACSATVCRPAVGSHSHTEVTITTSCSVWFSRYFCIHDILFVKTGSDVW